MKQAVNTQLPNRHVVVVGSSGGGKSTLIKARTRQESRLVVWDPHFEYDAHRLRSLAELSKAIRAAGSKRFRLAYTPRDPEPQTFEQFAKLITLTMSADRPMAVVVDEVADVTHAGKAGKYSGQLYRGGRKFGLTIYTGSQRPQEVSKTIYSQSATRLACFTEDPKDRKAVESGTTIPAAEIAELPLPAEVGRVDYIEKQPAKAHQRKTHKFGKGK